MTHISEPTGRQPPKITGDGLNKLITAEKEEMSLQCDAQAFPVPSMRFVLFLTVVRHGWIVSLFRV